MRNMLPGHPRGWGQVEPGTAEVPGGVRARLRSQDPSHCPGQGAGLARGQTPEQTQPQASVTSVGMGMGMGCRPMGEGLDQAPRGEP